MKKSKLNFRTAVKKFNKLKVLVIGDLMGDKYVWGNNLRLSKEAPVPVIQVQKDVYEMGGAAHAAHNASLLGADIYLCGLVGFDDAAQSLRSALAEAGIDSGGLFPTTIRPTTLKVRVMSREYNTHLARFDYESDQPLSDSEMASLKGYIDSYINEIDVIIISDYAKGMFNRKEFAKYIINRTKKRGIPAIVDTKPGHFARFKNASVLLCTLKEAREYILLTHLVSMVDIDKIGKILLETTKCNCLVIIQDEKGFKLNVFGEQRIKTQELGKSLYNSVGLEDTATSVLAMSLASGLDLKSSMELVIRAIDIAASKPGTSVVTKEELLSTI